MKVVYIAAPFRGPNAWAIEQNIRLAESVGLEVAKLGAMPLIPHTNTRFFHGALPDEFWLEGTLALMYKADIVLFVGDWQKSSGCLAEHRQCEFRSCPKVYSIEELEAWLSSYTLPKRPLSV